MYKYLLHTEQTIKERGIKKERGGGWPQKAEQQRMGGPLPMNSLYGPLFPSLTHLSKTVVRFKSSFKVHLCSAALY
jgi:hypothetical protein